MTKEQPILFSDPMVRAILAGSKTQTRRIIKASADWCGDINDPPDAIDQVLRDADSWIACVRDQGQGYRFRCPYGVPGDRLWVRETWQRHSNGNPESEARWEGEQQDVFYLADETDPDSVPLSGKWRAARYMPRWASRILLQVTSVRGERLQDITEADAAAEGIEPAYGPGCDEPTWIDGPGGFRWLWDQLNTKRGFPWSSNPWVWVVGFERTES